VLSGGAELTVRMATAACHRRVLYGVGSVAGTVFVQSSAHLLFGRERDVALLAAFVEQAADNGAAVLVSGEAGVGKTALISRVSSDARRRGVRVLRASGSEFEASLSFAGLNQLLHPVLDQLDQLDDADQHALRTALGIGRGRASEELAVANATLRLLTALADAEPLLVVVDDVNWLDRASSAVLAYVARRVGGTRVALIATMRAGERTPFERGGLDTHELQPLAETEASALLQARFPRLTLHTRGRLLAEAQGNPLALLELPIALNVRRAASPAPPRVLPLTERLEQVFASRLDPLPPASREVLLLAVLDGTGDPGVLRREGGSGVDALAPAERARLVFIDDTTGRLTFHHPLIRSAVFQSSTASERRRAHQVLAERRRDDPERQAWHLAEAAVEPDEPVAALLQEVAHQHLRRGDAVGAIAELLRAAELSPAGEGRGFRLAEAAYLGAIVNGDLRSVPRLLEDARSSDPEHTGGLAGAVAGAYHLLNDDGEVDLAHRLLVSAIETLPNPGDAHNKQLHEALVNLVMICFFGGRPELWKPVHAALDRLDPGPPELLAILVKTFGDPVHADAEMLERLDRQIDGLGSEPTPARAVRVCTAGAYVDRLPRCRPALRRVVEVGREGGAITSAIEALFLLGNDAFFSGQWNELEAVTDDGLRLCDEYGYRLLRWPGVFLRALLAAARGDETTAREFADDMTRWAGPRRAGLVGNYARHVLTILALGKGEYEAAFEHASAVSAPGVLGAHEPHALWLILDLVEAAVRANRPSEAAAHVEALQRTGVAEISSRLAIVTGAAAAMTATDDDEKRTRFERVLGMPEIDRWPFEHARIQLAHGEHVRRARATGEARVHLQRALDGFRLLDARPWVEKTASELRAAGAATGPPAPRAAVSITPQQLEIAQLAAHGLTNKQIGERLYLSHRTVATHLYQLYPKLGIASRAALSDALAELAPADETAGRVAHPRRD
jgi:DNA-binding CsgD family transcriptional regulator